MSTREAAIALRRFGLGARPGDMQSIASDARGYLLQSLTEVDAALIADAKLEPSHANAAVMSDGAAASKSMPATANPVPMTSGPAAGTGTKSTAAPPAQQPK